MKNTPVVLSQNPAHAGTELLHQSHVLKHTHEFAVARHTRKAEEILLALPVNETAVRRYFDPVRKDLKHGRDLARVVVMHDGVDDRLAQRNAPDQCAVNALLARDLRASDIFDLKLVQNAVRRLDERTIAVLLVFDEVDLVLSRLLYDLDGHAVFIGQEVRHIVVLAVGREQFKRACKLIVEGKPAFLIINFELREGEIPVWERGCCAASDCAGA